MNTAIRPGSANEPKSHIETVRVNLGDRSYDILVGYDWLDRLGDALRKVGINGENAMVFTSPVIGGLYYDRLKRALERGGFRKIHRHDIPDGETNKNLAQFGLCCEAIALHFSPGESSPPLVVNLGGGVVSDTAGFVAATFLRSGVPYVQIPTTLLGCVDCGVGGKVGVNSATVKNIIGRFYQPRLVFADLALLGTLPPREIRSGIAEVIKYGVVCDQELFFYLEQHMEDLLALEPTVLTHVVRECYRIKANVVERDEEDRGGQRIVLNYGHTIGHALEIAVRFKLTHGEAIAVGMIAANRIALALQVVDQAFFDRVHALIVRAGLPVAAQRKDVSVDQLMESMSHDKKFSRGENLFVLPTKIGAYISRRNVPMEIIKEAVNRCLAD